MSGGAFDYLCYKEAEDLFQPGYREHLDEIQKTLERYDCPLTARVVSRAKCVIDAAVNELHRMFADEDLERILHDVEWFASSDYGVEDLRELEGVRTSKAHRQANLPNSSDCSDAPRHHDACVVTDQVPGLVRLLMPGAVADPLLEQYEDDGDLNFVAEQIRIWVGACDKGREEILDFARNGIPEELLGACMEAAAEEHEECVALGEAAAAEGWSCSSCGSTWPLPGAPPVPWTLTGLCGACQ